MNKSIRLKANTILIINNKKKVENYLKGMNKEFKLSDLRTVFSDIKATLSEEYHERYENITGLSIRSSFSTESGDNILVDKSGKIYQDFGQDLLKPIQNTGKYEISSEIEDTDLTVAYNCKEIYQDQDTYEIKVLLINGIEASIIA